jgi:hypothetical protein
MKENKQWKNPSYSFISKEQKPGYLNWMKKVDFYNDYTADFNFFRINPLCVDGRSEEMESELKKRGWESGYMGLTFKRNISLEELLSSTVYALSYEKVFKSKVKNPYAINPFSVTEFLSLVDSQAERELARIKTTQKQALNTKSVNKELIDTIIKEGKLETPLYAGTNN